MLDQMLSKLSIAVLLGVAYSANIGGMATLIGTPPNALLAGYLSESHGIEIGFGQWLLLGLPLVLIALPLVYLILTRVSFKLDRSELSGAREMIGRELRALGSMRRAEKLVTFVFVAAGLLWGGKQPVVMHQNTGFFESGDSVRGLALDLELPIVMLLGYRGWNQGSPMTDSALLLSRAWFITTVLIWLTMVLLMVFRPTEPSG